MKGKNVLSALAFVGKGCLFMNSLTVYMQIFVFQYINYIFCKRELPFSQ